LSIPSRVTLSGSFSPDQVTIRHDPVSDRIIHPELEAKLDREWERQQRLAAERGVTLYDAPVYRLNAHHLHGDTLTLHLAPEPYRIHSTLKALHNDRLIREDHVDKVLIADALIRTRDDVYLFAHIRKLVEHTTYLIGGSCTPERQILTTSTDLWNYMRSKIDLILRTGEARIQVGMLLGFIQNEVGCIHAIFDTEVDATYEEILEHFQPGNGVGGLECVPAERLVPFLESGEGYVPAVAPLVTGLVSPLIPVS